MAFLERMKGQDYINKTREYLDYLEEHLENVRRAFCELSEKCDGMWWVGDDMSWHTIRGEVEWHEFMNYMLLENQTLSSMKQEHFEYVKSNKPDPAPTRDSLCHSDMITCILLLMPPEDQKLTPEQYKRKIK